jgi:hypothetical protein
MYARIVEEAMASHDDMVKECFDLIVVEATGGAALLYGFV